MPAITTQIVVLGEEDYDCSSAEFYGASHPLVIRNYWYGNCASRENVLIVPMGHKDPVDVMDSKCEVHHDGDIATKNLAYSMISGHWTMIRNTLAGIAREQSKHFPSLNPYRIELNGRLGGADYNAVMCHSKLALTPCGNVMDTWRFTEAMHQGSIPVTTDGNPAGYYYRHFVPQAVMDETFELDFGPWEGSKLHLFDGDGAYELYEKRNQAVFEAMARLAANSTALRERAARLSRAYREWTHSWRAQVAERVAAVGVAGVDR